MKKTKYRATIFNGHSHIERVVWEDENGYRYVRINCFFFNVDADLKNYDVDVWYNG